MPGSQTNVRLYPTWQKWLRDHQPRLLVVWGRYDPSFTVAGAEAYGKDVPSAEIHILDAGHFALDEKLTKSLASRKTSSIGRSVDLKGDPLDVDLTSAIRGWAVPSAT